MKFIWIIISDDSFVSQYTWTEIMPYPLTTGTKYNAMVMLQVGLTQKLKQQVFKTLHLPCVTLQLISLTCTLIHVSFKIVLIHSRPKEKCLETNLSWQCC